MRKLRLSISFEKWDARGPESVSEKSGKGTQINTGLFYNKVRIFLSDKHVIEKSVTFVLILNLSQNS